MYQCRDRARVRERIGFVCDLFPQLAARARQAAGTMSGGEQRMLEIGRALMWEPRLVLMDEPWERFAKSSNVFSTKVLT